MMTGFRFLTLHLLLLLLLLVTAVCDTQYDDYSPTPDYDADNNLTIEYTFYSNTSSDELELFLDSVGGKEDATVTVPTTAEPTEKSLIDRPGSKSPPDSGSLRVSLELKVLIWTLMSLMVLS